MPSTKTRTSDPVRTRRYLGTPHCNGGSSGALCFCRTDSCTPTGPVVKGPRVQIYEGGISSAGTTNRVTREWLHGGCDLAALSLPSNQVLKLFPGCRLSQFMRGLVA